MKAEDVVARARSAIGHQAFYILGKGGMHPENVTPWPPGMPQLGCDCSGFVAWCVGVSRQLRKNIWPMALEAPYKNGEWFETSALYRDARSEYGIVTQVGWAQARPGHILVWGDRVHIVDGKPVPRQGHVGVVSEVDRSGPCRVVHCSHGNWTRTKDAVQETDVDIFVNNGAIAARVWWVEDTVA